jgi:hypothetical protein
MSSIVHCQSVFKPSNLLHIHSWHENIQSHDLSANLAANVLGWNASCFCGWNRVFSTRLRQNAPSSITPATRKSLHPGLVNQLASRIKHLYPENSAAAHPARGGPCRCCVSDYLVLRQIIKQNCFSRQPNSALILKAAIFTTWGGSDRPWRLATRNARFPQASHRSGHRRHKSGRRRGKCVGPNHTSNPHCHGGDGCCRRVLRGYLGNRFGAEIFGQRAARGNLRNRHLRTRTIESAERRDRESAEPSRLAQFPLGFRSFEDLSLVSLHRQRRQRRRAGRGIVGRRTKL